MGSSFHLLSHHPASLEFAENLWLLVCFAFSSLFRTFAVRITAEEVMTPTDWRCTTFSNFPSPMSWAWGGKGLSWLPLTSSPSPSRSPQSTAVGSQATGFLRQMKAQVVLFRGGGDPSYALAWRPQVLVTRSGSHGRGCWCCFWEQPCGFCLGFPNNGPSNRGSKWSGLAVFRVSHGLDGSARFYLPSRFPHSLLHEDLLRPQPHTWMHFS